MAARLEWQVMSGDDKQFFEKQKNVSARLASYRIEVIMSLNQIGNPVPLLYLILWLSLFISSLRNRNSHLTMAQMRTYGPFSPSPAVRTGHRILKGYDR